MIHRSSELRLQNGGAFEYLLLIYDPKDEETYIQVSYAYG